MVPTSVSKSDETAFRSRLLEWAESNVRIFPWRADIPPYQILVAEVLLQQTLATKVEPIFEEFVRRYPQPADLVGMEPKTLAELLDPLGFQNIRAEALVQNAERIAEHGMPSDQVGLRDLHYVGDYGVNATLCFGFGERRPIVDANVVRVYNRAFGCEFENAQDDCAWEFAEQMLPEEEFQRYNLALLDFGAQICTAGNPRCGQCFYTNSCEYYLQERNTGKE